MRKLLALLVIFGFVLSVGCDTGKKPSTPRAPGAPSMAKPDDGMGTDKGATSAKTEDKKPEDKKPEDKKPDDKKPDDKKPEDKKPDGAGSPKKGNG
jgi:hypothetical protein